MNEIENTISELSQVYQQFETASGISDVNGLNLIIGCANELKKIYSAYITVIHNLENASSVAEISTSQTLFKLYGNDFFYEKGGRKFSLGVFIIKQPEYHMVIPVKLTDRCYYIGTGTERQIISYVATNIYKPIIIDYPYNSRNALHVPGMSGFTWRRGTEPAKLFSVDINHNNDRHTFKFSKLQICKIKKAIETTMTAAERPQAVAAPSVQQEVELTLPQEVELTLP